MGPKQKGGGAKPKQNTTEEVEETLQAVVCYITAFGIVSIDSLLQGISQDDRED